MSTDDSNVNAITIHSGALVVVYNTKFDGIVVNKYTGVKNGRWIFYDCYTLCSHEVYEESCGLWYGPNMGTKYRVVMMDLIEPIIAVCDATIFEQLHPDLFDQESDGGDGMMRVATYHQDSINGYMCIPSDISPGVDLLSTAVYNNICLQRIARCVDIDIPDNLQSHGLNFEGLTGIGVAPLLENKEGEIAIMDWEIPSRQRCNACTADLHWVKKFYKCSVCYEYRLCVECVDKGEHSFAHGFYVEPNNNEDTSSSDESAPEENNDRESCADGDLFY